MSIFTRKKSGSVLLTLPPRAGILPVIDTSDSSDKDKSSGSKTTVQTTPQKSDKEVLSEYLTTLYSAYRPNPVSYEARSADELRAEIEGWLRPAYDEAIAARRRATEGYRAELDADAISRGMGASTYVTDVKSRQMEAESLDIARMESEYGATLAKTVNEQMSEERERALTAETTNRQNDYDAYMKAYSAALTLFETYKKTSGQITVSGGGSGGSSGGSDDDKEVVPTTAENCDLFLSLLTEDERADVYLPTTEKGQQYHDEIIASVGLAGYYLLMGKYPSSLG